MRWMACLLLTTLSLTIETIAQTTQGLITGQILDQATLRSLAAATIEYEHVDTNTRGQSRSSADGNYYLPLLPPGQYRVRVSLSGYQAREVYNVSLSVAGYVRIDFQLRPLRDVWERNLNHRLVLQDNTMLPFYGPDLDPSYVGSFEPEHQRQGQLEPSLSDVFDPRAIATLPLAGRDVYAALVLQPGVTAESTTNRSLGLSANGQRPTSSSFLLDGIDYTDKLLGGPAFQPAPEMVQEYRVSINNFSAEYGRTSGYIANAVIRSGGSGWHGIIYGDINNQALNANTFQHNVNAVGRTTQHQIAAGISAGGRIPHSNLRSWTAIDRFGSRSYTDPTNHILPTQNFAARLDPGSRAANLLRGYPPIQWANVSPDDYGSVTLQAPVTLRRLTGVERLDYPAGEKNRLTARIAADQQNQPDFFWTPYGKSPLRESSVGLAIAATRVWSPSIVMEIRAGAARNTRSWDPALSNLPGLVGSLGVELPAISNINGWHEKTETIEISGSMIVSKGVNTFKAGAGVLTARPETQFTFPSAGQFSFNSLTDPSKFGFTGDNPSAFEIAVSRLALQQGVVQRPDPTHSYRYRQPFIFVQNDVRVTPRVTLNGGLRYERFPAPVNIGGTPDVVINPGAGATADERFNHATFSAQNGSVFSVRPNTLAVRLGFSIALSPKKGTILRGGGGTFYDRPPDNFWATISTNGITFPNFVAQPLQRRRPLQCQLQKFYKNGNYQLPPPCPIPIARDNNFLNLLLFEPDLRIARVESAFLSLQQPLGKNATFELNATGSRGTNLLATDVLNRDGPSTNDLPQVTYRTDQGASVYSSLSGALRYRTTHSSLNMSWSWSHSIDNQSDPLQGEFLDLGFGNETDRTGQKYRSGYTVEGNPRLDRGNSDFDQRQNFVGWASFALPNHLQSRWNPVLRNWGAAAVFALRSGLPYSTYAGIVSCNPFCNRRANLSEPAAAEQRVAAKGGVQLLNSAAFEIPQRDNDYGNTGRNSFRGPGLANLDLSISRTLSLKQFGEQTRVTLRADAFNVLNHPNLLNPEAYLGNGTKSQSFGIALFGSGGNRSGFPALTPLLSNPRQIHLLLRVEF